MGQLIWTPAMIRDYVRRTDDLVKGVARDMAAAVAAGAVDDRTVAAWKDWVGSWRRFLADAEGSWSGGTVTRAEGYRRELKQWRQRIAAAGVKPKSQPIPDEPQSALLQWPAAAGTGAVIAVLAVLYLLSQTSRGTA
ncbi:MAG: hypothetical protein OEZ01_00550 [Candidatus Heimdallarchaeota archaeon]|nr:hypothetical protein [Candidatus Heimdallarchaeota archaeon]